MLEAKKGKEVSSKKFGYNDFLRNAVFWVADIFLVRW